MDKYSGSGIIPIIRDSNNIYYMILFVSSIRNKHTIYPTLEDAGGGYEGTNIKISAIRELKEESSMLFNLEKLHDIYIKRLHDIMNITNISIENSNKVYMSYFVYLELMNDNFDLINLKKEFISNMRYFWKNGFSHYTENKDIVFIPLNNTIHNMIIIDSDNNKYFVFDRTMMILLKFVKKYKDINIFIKEINKKKIVLVRNIVNNYDYGKKHVINNLISYN
jgi:hypothetical protein